MPSEAGENYSKHDFELDNSAIDSIPFQPLERKSGPIAFLVWAPASQRAENLSDSLGANLFLLSYKFKKKIYSPIKYPMLFAKSISELKKLKPAMIICQEPSFFCTLAALAYRALYRAESEIVIDAHTAAIQVPWSHAQFLHKKILARARLVIVTNDGMRGRLQRDYGIENCVVLPDKIPNLRAYQAPATADLPVDRTDGSFRAAVVCSFAPDEPIREILVAARIARDVTFYITGDYASATSWSQDIQRASLLPNVVFTGYLSKPDYAALLSDVNVVIALTKRGDTMLSGAHEALGLAKPLITSAHPVLLQYFSRGTIHVGNRASEIAEAVQKVRDNESALAIEARSLKEIRDIEWHQQFGFVRKLLGLGIGEVEAQSKEQEVEPRRQSETESA